MSRRLGRLAGDLVRLVPEIAERVPDLAPPLRADPETEQYRLFDAVAGWLHATAETAPLVLVLDDLHWATRPTLQLLRHVVRMPGPAGCSSSPRIATANWIGIIPSASCWPTCTAAR